MSWRSLSNEYWNGFTVGVQGTAVEFCDANPTAPGCGPSNNVPEPASLALLGLVLLVDPLRRVHSPAPSPPRAPPLPWCYASSGVRLRRLA